MVAWKKIAFSLAFAFAVEYIVDMSSGATPDPQTTNIEDGMSNDNTPKFSYLISDERYGETCLVDNLDQFMRDMEDSMFPASAVSQKLAELQEIAAELDEECEETAETIAQTWRDELLDALQDVEAVALPDGREGWMIGDGSVYVETANGLASYAGELSYLMEGNED